LLRDQGAVSASGVHAAIVRGGGVGDELVLGRVPRSPATRQVLERAFDVGAERGSFAPQPEHVLLALAENERVMAVLREVGVTDVEALVDAKPTDGRRAALSYEKVKHHLFELGCATRAPMGSRRRLCLSASPPRHGARSERPQKALHCF
jgi:hypothetical protein